MGYRAALSSAILLGPMLLACDAAPSTCDEMEEFLRAANIGTVKNIPLGTTRPKRATLDDGKLRHDAEVQTVHTTRISDPDRIASKDWWEFNVAAYELAKILEVNMIPPYVARKVDGRPASLSWWINDAMMEIDRVRKKLQPPNLDQWDKELQVTQVFYQLVANTSTHLTNYLIDKNWHLWMIDFTEAFGPDKSLPNKHNLVRCDRKLLANLRKLDRQTLTAKLGQYLTRREIEGLLARRDKIVDFFGQAVERKSEAAVLFDLSRVGERCGAGL